MQRQLPEELACATCVWALGPDEDGLVECAFYPPEAYVRKDGVVNVRPRLHPSNGCGQHGTFVLEQ